MKVSLKVLFRKPVLAWAFYDWANSAYATTVMAVFFPIIFHGYWSVSADPIVTTARLGTANSIASLIIAFLAPVLGAIADRGGARKKFLFTMAALGIVMTGGLYFLEEGNWGAAMLVYLLAGVGFAGGNIFYDSMIVDVAKDKEFDLVSAYGYALGYLGGGLLVVLHLFMFAKPEVFGFDNKFEAIRVAFVTVALWWAAFSLPMMFLVKETPTVDKAPRLEAIRAGFKQLAATFREIRALKTLLLLLVAYWFYIDGVHTVIKMATIHGLALGFGAVDLALAIVITQFVGFPAALAFGWLGTRFGAKRMILAALSVYVIVTIRASFMTDVGEFYAMAIAIGLVQGGVQSLSRSLYARMIPEGKSAEFFGFYNMLGKFAAVLGPAMIAATVSFTGSNRIAILAIIPLYLIGGTLLFFVDEKAGERTAAKLEEL